MIIAPLSDFLTVKREGAVVWLSLNRPEKFNALNIELNEAIFRACQSLDPEVQIVVLRANGKHFCGGSDLKDLYQVDRKEAERVIQIEIDACQALLALPQFTVCLVHGKCLGGGACLPLYCDFRIGRAGVEFALPEVSLGWVPPYGLERLTAQVPRPFALKMLLTGRICGDREALDRGLIQRLVETEEEAQALVTQLAAIPPQTLRDTLALVSSKNLPASREADRKALAAFLDHFDTDTARNKIAAFVEKKGK